MNNNCPAEPHFSFSHKSIFKCYCVPRQKFSLSLGKKALEEECILRIYFHIVWSYEKLTTIGWHLGWKAEFWRQSRFVLVLSTPWFCICYLTFWIFIANNLLFGDYKNETPATQPFLKLLLHLQNCRSIWMVLCGKRSSYNMNISPFLRNFHLKYYKMKRNSTFSHQNWASIVNIILQIGN